MAKVRISSDILKPFSGEGDVVAWLKKVRLVAKLLPLYLEGDALDLYMEMEEDDQKQIEQIEARLKEVFTDDAFAAYRKVTMIKCNVYANKIRQLVGLAKFKGDGLERLTKLAFVMGFPDTVSIGLQQVPNIDVETIGGTSRACCGVGVVPISTEEGNSAKIDVLVVRGKPLGFDLLLGIDAIKALGGIVVGPTGSVQLGDRRTTRYAVISFN